MSLSQESALQKALAEASAIFKVEIELPVETPSDIVRTHQSIINYFETNGEGFREKVCKNCNQVFAYAWNSDSIAYCSIPCSSAALEKRGLRWDPKKPLAERYGRFVPAVVPASALSLLKDLVGLPKDDSDDTPPEDC